MLVESELQDSTLGWVSELALAADLRIDGGQDFSSDAPESWMWWSW